MKYPGWKERLAATAYYFGAVPVLRPFRFCRDAPFVKHHAAQALATIVAFFAVLLGVCLCIAGLSYLIVFRPDLYEQLPTPEGWEGPRRDALLFVPLVLCWLLPWVGGLLLALFGSVRPLPLIGRLSRKPLLLRLAFTGNVLLLAVAGLTLGLAVHASSLTRDDDEPAAAYLLYDDMGVIPRWVMNLGFYRVSLTAQARWGPGSIVVAPLDEHHMRLALRHGRFVVLACHGRAGDVMTPKLRITPISLAKPGAAASRGLCVAKTDTDGGCGPWIFLEAGQDLRFLYNSACEGGNKAQEWEHALAPAEVRTFNRLSLVLEHVLWLWIDGPSRVREME